MGGGKQRGWITVEVAYARPDEQAIVELELLDDATAQDAIEASGILKRYPELDLEYNKIGVFGEAADLGRRLRHRDRVEIYRPLVADPKESRRRRAAVVKRTRQPTERH